MRNSISPAEPPSVDFSVGGFQSFSVSDWPHRLAAVIFAQGCPLRCGYCHNPHLIPLGAGQLTFRAVCEKLDSRRTLLDGVVFSGGEPCAQRNLPQAITAVRQMGFKIGLHTSGACPDMLERVLADLDWVGLDIKGPEADYARITGTSAWRKTLASLEMLIANRTPFEVRTTWHPDLFTNAALVDLAQNLSRLGVAHYAVQRMRRPTGHGGKQRWEPGPAPSAGELAQLATLFPTFTLR